MKQIFDWLREQINEGREFEHDERNECFNNALDYTIRRVDEAEAKWESECCEWKRNENTKALILSPHNPHSAMWAVDVKMYPYCNCCGKPIKISEVE